MTSNPPSNRSLAGTLWARLRGPARRAGGSDAPAPLSMIAGLEALCAACGRPASAAQLGAALPVEAGGLAPQFAPLALARAGLEGRWERTRLARMKPADLPVLARLGAGGVVLVTALAAGMVHYRDGAGEQVARLDTLAPRLSGDMLCCGQIDPENGMSDEDDHALVRRNPWLWLAGAYLSQRRRLGQMLVAALLLNLCALTVPLYMRAIYDRVVPNLALESLWALSAGVILALGFELALRQVKAGYVDTVGIRVGQAVQHRAITAVLYGRAQQNDASVGSMLMALRDVEQLSLLVPQAVVAFAIDMPCFFAFVGLIGLIGGWTMAAPVLGAVALIAVGLVTNYAVKLASRRGSKLGQARNNLLVEVTEGWSTIKANQAEGRFLARWGVLSDHIGVTTHQQRHWGKLPGAAAGLIVQAVTVAVVVISVFQIKAGMMTSGAMVAVIMLAGRAMGPVAAAIAMVGRLYQSLSQFQGLAKILQTEPERRLSDPAIGAGRVTGRIVLAGLGHSHDGAVPCLAGINLAIAPGERVALIGRSGSGKSTLLRIMAGLLPLQQGRYTLDGHAAAHFAAAQLRSQMVYCAQDATIFDTTNWDNILLGLPEPAPATVEAAIRASGLGAHVEHTLDGFMKKVGPRGTALSGGQRQSLLLARALVRDPPVLLLDEPTAAMDIASEQAVINGLAQVAQGKTLVIATHRLALLDLVERVVWLEDGRVIADRPRAEVLAMLRGRGAAPPTTQVA